MQGRYKRCPGYRPTPGGASHQATGRTRAGSCARAGRRLPRTAAMFLVRTCVPKRSPPFWIMLRLPAIAPAGGFGPEPPGLFRRLIQLRVSLQHVETDDDPLSVLERHPHLIEISPLRNVDVKFRFLD